MPKKIAVLEVKHPRSGCVWMSSNITVSDDQYGLNDFNLVERHTMKNGSVQFSGAGDSVITISNELVKECVFTVHVTEVH